MKARWRQLAQQERGSVAIIVAGSMVAVMGLVALGTDVGRLFIERNRLSAIADAAALAGAEKLPADPAGAVSALQAYLSKNGINPGSATVTVSSDNHTISVSMTEQVSMTFARVIGVKQSPVIGAAAAQTTNISGYLGAAPLGVPRADWQIGQQVTLKMDADTGTIAPGNYMALALGKSGASAYESNLMYGYNSWLRAGDWIDTQTGNMAGPTVRAVNYRINQDPNATWQTVTRKSQRLVVIPILKDYDVNGKGQVNVVGFGVFYLEQGIDSGNNKGSVTGRFLRLFTEGEGSLTAPDYGLYAVKLIQ